MKKKLKYVAVGLVACVLAFWMTKGVLYRWAVTYEPATYRGQYVLSDEAFMAWIDAIPLPEAEAEAVVDIAQAHTARHLAFTTETCPSDPNALFHSQRANCIGYAQFFGMVCDRLMERAGLPWRATPQAAHLRVFGWDIHHFLSGPFWKDHDIVLIAGPAPHELIAVDPSLYDYFGVARVSMRTEN